MKAAVLWDIRLSCVVTVYRHFDMMYLAHFQGSRVQEEKKTSTPKIVIYGKVWVGTGNQ
jgi:hypothetical protein